MTYLDTPVDSTASQWPSASVSYGDMCDFYNAYHATAVTMKGDIESLNNTISVLKRQNSYGSNCIANAKVIILEAFDGDDFDKDVVTNIAETLDIELTKEYEVTINVTFSGTVSVPLGFDMDCDLENYIRFEASNTRWGDGELECDLYSDGIDITVTD